MRPKAFRSMTGLVPTLVMLVACAALPGCEGARPLARVPASPIPKTTPATPPRAADPTMDDVIAALQGGHPGEPQPLVPLALPKVRDATVATHAHLQLGVRMKAYDALPRQGIAYSSTAPESLVHSLDHLYTGLVLLEPVALAEGPDSIEAVCRMDDILEFAGNARAFAKMAEGPGTPPGPRAMIEGHLVWLERAEEMRGRYFAKSLRTKVPGQGCFLAPARKALNLLGKSPNQKQKIAALFDALLARDGSKMRTTDALDLAAIRLAIDDTKGAEARLAEARGLLARTSSVDDGKRLVRLEKELETTKRLVALPTTDVYARVDILLGLDRRDEARALLEALEPTAPRSVKTAARLALIVFQEVASHDSLTKALSAAADEMRSAKDGPHDEMVAQVALGVEGAHIVEAMADGTLVRELTEARPRLIVLTDELAKWNPARSGALRIFVDVLGSCEKSLVAGDLKCLLATLPELLPRAAALKKKYPDEIDVDRAVTSLTMFAKDRRLALEMLVLAPSEKARKSRDQSLDRARASLTLASVLESPEDVAKLRKSLDAIVAQNPDPATRDPEKEALEADFELVSATLTKGAAQPEAFRKAERAYIRALERATEESRARIVNALAALALREGKRAEANAMLEAYAGPKDWPFQVTRIAAMDGKTRTVEMIRALDKGESESATTTLELWKASLFTDKKEAQASEIAALAGSRAPGYVLKANAVTRGIEWSGRMNLSLGLNARGHAFSASAYADLWFVPLPKVRLDDVAKRHKGK